MQLRRSLHALGFAAGFLVTLTHAGEGRGEECVVSGTSVTLEKLDVRPPGAPPFLVDVKGVPARVVVPKTAGAPARVEVEGALSFSATRKDVWLTVAVDHESPGGLVKLQRGARLAHARAVGATAIGAAVLYADDVLEGEDKEPDEVVAPVRIPCRRLALGATAGDPAPAAEPRAPSAVWEPRKPGPLRLWSGPRPRGRSVQIRAGICEGECFTVRQLVEKDGWLRVERTGAGVTVAGWVPRSELRRAPTDVTIRGSVCSGQHGQTFRGGGWSGRKPESLYEGPATVRAGTRVLAAAPEGAWAVVTTDLQVRVRHLAGDPWVELLELPGVTGAPPSRVAVESVGFPTPRPPVPPAVPPAAVPPAAPPEE